jgi:pyruvate, water dikinase
LTRTKIMMNVGIPEQAFGQGLIPNDGVGLAREEFIIKLSHRDSPHGAPQL